MSDAIGRAVTLASMDALARFAQPWLDRAARIGADPRDDDEQRLRKALLVLVCVLILPISLAWGAIYLALGAASGFIAWLYLIISIAAIVTFARTRDTEWLLKVELLNILLAPTISMAFLGGFIASGAVGLWGILAPLGALVFDGARAGVRWFVAFVVVFLVSGIVGEVAGGGRSTLPSWFESTMIALNVTVTGAVVFMLLVQFVRQREEALAELRVEQDRAETLLLNILPRSIADKLKADTSTIADQFAAASILFADVVDFTPLSDRLQPAEVVGILDDLFTHFDLLAERYDVEKIKTIGDCYMVAAGVPTPRADHARVMALDGPRHARRDAIEGRGRSPRARDPDRDQFGAGRGRGHRTEALPLRPLGRCREHGQPDGIARHARPDPGHAGDLRAALRRVRAGAARHRPDQGQGRRRDVVPRRSPLIASRRSRPAART